MDNSPPSTNDTPNIQEVKASLKHDRQGIKNLNIKLQGLILNALEDALKDRNETPRQFVLDLLEDKLIAEHYLPSWYKERGSGIS